MQEKKQKLIINKCSRVESGDEITLGTRTRSTCYQSINQSIYLRSNQNVVTQ